MKGNGNSLNIHDRPVFGNLLFAQCWEDPAMDMEALDVGPGKTVLSVTSGGCNTLSLATLEPDRIIAVDLNPVQSALLELKIEAIRSLSHGELLAFLGVRRSSERWDLYHALRAGLCEPSLRYWDTQRASIEHGVLTSGRYERYLGVFRRLLRGIHRQSRIERLFSSRSLDEQRGFFENEWDTALWRAFFRIFFSRRVLGLGGLDPAFFTYVNGIPSFGEHFRARARHVLVDIPVSDNYFIAQICLGRYLDELAVPPYLQSNRYRALKRSVSRIEIRTGELGEVLRELPSHSIDAFNYSNIFEWVAPDVFEQMLEETHRVGKPGARLTYRNLLVQRRTPESLSDRLVAHPDLSARLLEKDRSFVYRNFEVASVRKNGCRGI